MQMPSQALNGCFIPLTITNMYVQGYGKKGKFTLNMSRQPFSRRPLDESHEQNNACVKADGGAIGLTQNHTALLQWMVSAPPSTKGKINKLGGGVNSLMYCVPGTNCVVQT